MCAKKLVCIFHRVCFICGGCYPPVEAPDPAESEEEDVMGEDEEDYGVHCPGEDLGEDVGADAGEDDEDGLLSCSKCPNRFHSKCVWVCHFLLCVNHVLSPQQMSPSSFAPRENGRGSCYYCLQPSEAHRVNGLGHECTSQRRGPFGGGQPQVSLTVQLLLGTFTRPL